MDTIRVEGDVDHFFEVIESWVMACEYDRMVAEQHWKSCGLSVNMAQSCFEEPLIDLEEEDDAPGR